MTSFYSFIAFLSSENLFIALVTHRALKLRDVLPYNQTLRVGVVSRRGWNGEEAGDGEQKRLEASPSSDNIYVYPLPHHRS